MSRPTANSSSVNANNGAGEYSHVKEEEDVFDNQPRPALKPQGSTWSVKSQEDIHDYEHDIETGHRQQSEQWSHPTYADDNFRVYLSEADTAIRLAFIRKVYSILSFQLLFTMGVVFFFAGNLAVRNFIRTHVWLYYLLIVLSIVVVLVLVCVPRLIERHPVNLILLGVFTVLEAFIVGFITSLYNTDVVLKAVIITAVVTIGLTLFTIQSKIDFSPLAGVLFVCLIVLLIGTLFQLVFHFGPFGTTLWACFGALVFSLFIMFDTWMILKVYTSDMYVAAALNLYLDIINLFIYILQIIGSR